MLSNQIMQHKQVVLNGYMNAKQSASNGIDFWDKTLKKCKENFRDILKELEQSIELFGMRKEKVYDTSRYNKSRSQEERKRKF